MNDQEKALSIYRKFFTISVAAFDFNKVAEKVLGKGIEAGAMERLHRSALTQITFYDENGGDIEQLLADLDLMTRQMEAQAMINNVEKISKARLNKDFKIGGIVGMSSEGFVIPDTDNLRKASLFNNGGIYHD